MVGPRVIFARNMYILRMIEGGKPVNREMVLDVEWSANVRPQNHLDCFGCIPSLNKLCTARAALSRKAEVSDVDKS